MRCRMFAPQEFIKASEEERKTRANGCGPKNFSYIPDRLLGMSIKPACMIHDFDYALGETYEDKERADRIFLNNMLRAVKVYSKNRFTAFPRFLLAVIYYACVSKFGGPAFWDSKNGDHEVTEVDI